MPFSRRLINDCRNVFAAVQEVYADLALRPIERQCNLRTECCHFKLTGQTPYLTKGEALLAAKAFKATGRRLMSERSDGACPLLNAQTGRCLIYENRPFGCRTHFCQLAGGPYKRSEVLDLIRRLEKIDSELCGCGAQKLPIALRDALKELS